MKATGQLPAVLPLSRRVSAARWFARGLSALAGAATTLTALSAELPADLCTGGDAPGTGLRGAYYTADPASAAPAFVRIDGQVAAERVRALPPKPRGLQPRWVRWCGWIRPAITGAYAFPAPAGVRIEVARRTVTADGAATLPAELEAGRSYAILVEMPVEAATGDFRLRWTPPFGATYPVPATVLFPPVDTVRPGC